MNVIFIFTVWFLLAQALLTALQLPFGKKKIKKGLRGVIIAGKALFAILLAALVMAGSVQLRFLQPLMMALYCALLSDAAADAVSAVYYGARGKERKFGAVKALSLVFGALFFTYGVLNMEAVTPKYHTYTSEKLREEHTLVFITDLHVGSAQPMRVTEKTITEVKALHPDFIVLGGDIVDDYTTKEEMEQCIRLFADFENPVYFLYGNHERQGHAEFAGGPKFTQAQLSQTLAENGIVVLKDEYVKISSDLLLLGREDLSEGEGRAEISSLSNPAPEAYLIVADHQPVEFRANLAAGTDLQLSGHTHAGQLFPLRALYSVIDYCYGEYEEGNAVMLVSAGACGWRMPMRTDAHCNYEVITLKPAE